MQALLPSIVLFHQIIWGTETSVYRHRLWSVEHCYCCCFYYFCRNTIIIFISAQWISIRSAIFSATAAEGTINRSPIIIIAGDQRIKSALSLFHNRIHSPHSNGNLIEIISNFTHELQIMPNWTSPTAEKGTNNQGNGKTWSLTWKNKLKSK